MIVVLGVVFPPVDQRRFVPLVLAKVELSVGCVSVSTVLEETSSLCFLARLHSFRDDVGQSPLADHLQDVLTVELPIHQHVIDVNEFLSRVE
jgi:hypothetical protein